MCMSTLYNSVCVCQHCIIQYVYVNMKKMSLKLEEKLLWKLLQFLGMGKTVDTNSSLTDKDADMAKYVSDTNVYVLWFFDHTPI